MTKISRGEFLKTTSATAAGMIVIPGVLASQVKQDAKSPLCVFTKCLQFLDYDTVGEVLATAGYTGADFAVRKNGQVLPENVTTDLPKAVKALKKSGIPIVMMVTDIIDADNPLTEKVLGTASQSGIKYYRLGYFNYDRTKTVPENLDRHKVSMEKLEKVNRKYGIHGGYQNHSGTNVGGPVWDLHWIVKDCDPQYIGVQYDIRHAVAEGGVAWPLGFDLLAPWIKTSAIKDFYWKKNNNNKWVLQNVPLGEGMVDFDAYLKQHIKLGIKGPFTLHLEYDLGGAETGKTKITIPLDQIRTYLKNDLEWFRKKLASAGVA